jgi:alkaline phosphatase D
MANRRIFLRTLAGLAVGAAVVVPTVTRPRFAGNPFRLGVASGYPTPDSVVLWTRLAVDPRVSDGGIDPVAVPVHWEIARDEAMRDVVRSGVAAATPEWAHSVHVVATGLEPSRWYWYRFTAGDIRSPVGRTRTAPAAGVMPDSLRFTVASCQHYELGFYTAWRYAVADAPDLVVFLGDYIYEGSVTWAAPRKHRSPSPLTLDDYRLRYAIYKSDPDLAAAHAACPWILTWDDHEVSNDYAADRPDNGMPRDAFLARRAAAYRAYFEHMPLPPAMRPAGPAMRIYTALDWGALARFAILDGRQYRSVQACLAPGQTGGSNTVEASNCDELHDPRRTMLGFEQEHWLEATLAASPARWNLIAQQTPLARIDQQPGPGLRVWTDGWDGYPAARRRLLDFLATQRIANPVTLAGDVHMFVVSDLKADFDDTASPAVASEFCGTSITSGAWPQETVERVLPENPHIQFANSAYRGYLRMDLTPERLRADLRAMDSVRTPNGRCSTLASFVVEDRRPGLRRVE